MTPDARAGGRGLISEPGLFLDIREDDYHRDPCPEPSLSCSIAELLLTRSPLHAAAAHPRLRRFAPDEDESKFTLGKAAHEMLLGGGGRFLVVDAESWSTKAAKEERDAAKAHGLTPILAPQWRRALEMVEAIKAQCADIPELAGIFDTADAKEATVVWQEPDGSWCRCRPDILAGWRVLDLKFTGAGATPEEWASRTAFSLLYDFRAGFYLRGMSAIRPGPWRYQFAVCENKAPYALALFEVPPEALDGVQEPLGRALDMWSRCRRLGAWPGYSREIQWMEPPPSAAWRWAARSARAQYQTTDEITAAENDPARLVKLLSAG